MASARPSSSVVPPKHRKQIDRTNAHWFHRSRALPDQPSFVHVIDTMKLTASPSGPPPSCSFGLLSGERLPQLPTFSLFPRSGEISIAIRSPAPLVCSAAQLAIAERFHRFIFSRLLRLEKDAMRFDPARAPNGLLLVIVKKGSVLTIDWSLMSTIPDWSPNQPDNELRAHFKFFAQNYTDACIVPWYARKTDDYFFVVAILDEWHPSSKFPDKKHASYNEYILKKHELEVFDQTQPLLAITQYKIERLNLLSPTSEASKELKVETMQKMIPELVDVHPLPASMWPIVICLPSIFFRLNQVLLIDEFRIRVQLEAFSQSAAVVDGFLWRPLSSTSIDVGSISLDSPLFDVSVSASSPVARFGPELARLVEATTTAAARDAVSLERLETLGDSFLKFANGRFVYDAHAEGETLLSKIRAEQTGNEFLAGIGVAKGVDGVITTGGFDAEAWLPPGYVPTSPEAKANFLTDAPSEDDIADCVEALTGAYLLAFGPREAHKFVAWLGLCSEHPLHPKLFVPDALALFDERGIADLEKAIGYDFNNKGYIVQALTHTSCHTDRKLSYERLAFVGDAVLEFMLVRVLFDDARKYSPGALTDLKAALANNELFAELAVKFGFHKYLISKGEPVEKVIEEYRKKVEERGKEVGNAAELANGRSRRKQGAKAPRVLGDIFESVAGAIFLDAGDSFDRTWQVYWPMLRDQFEKCAQNPPSSPLRDVQDVDPSAAFSRLGLNQNGIFHVVLDLNGGKRRFGAAGSNYEIAERQAAKMALEWLREQEQAAK